MRMMVPRFDPAALDPEILAMGTSRSVRVKRIGRTFLIETAHVHRTGGHKEIEWKTVAISKGEDDHQSYVDAFQFLGEANVKIFEFMDAEHERNRK